MKLARLTTPAGTAVFPWLNKPDSKFESQKAKGGEYHVDLRLSEEDAAPLKAELEKLLAEWTTVKNAEQKKDKKKPFRPYDRFPWQDVEDEEGNPTGEVLFKFKRGAEWTDRDGNVRKNTLQFVDSTGAGIPKPDDIIGSGSKLRICFQVRGWASPLGISIALDLVAVQIIELNSFVGADSSDFGFSATEGFVAPPSEGDGVSKEVAAVGEGEDGVSDGDF